MFFANKFRINKVKRLGKFILENCFKKMLTKSIYIPKLVLENLISDEKVFEKMRNYS